MPRTFEKTETCPECKEKFSKLGLRGHMLSHKTGENSNAPKKETPVTPGTSGAPVAVAQGKKGKRRRVAGDKPAAGGATGAGSPPARGDDAFWWK